MALKKVVEVNLFNHKYHIRTDEDDKHINEVVEYVTRKMEDTVNNTKAVGTLQVAVMTVLNIADDYIKLKREVNRIEERAGRLIRTIEERV